MFTRDEALMVWDDLIADKDAFLTLFGEIVFSRQHKYPFKGEYGYFIRAKNDCYTKEMFDGYNRICEKHNCTYRIDNVVIIFYKPFKALPINIPDRNLDKPKT